MSKIMLFIPCYNCAREIIKVLESLKDYSSYFDKILVFDNRSTDNTLDNAVKWAEEHPEMPLKIMQNEENYNLGGTHKAAFEYALNNGYEYAAVLHGDNQGDISDIKEILEKGIYKQYDCCLGARFMKGSKLVNYSFIRILGNLAFNLLFSVCLLKKLYDLGGGLNIYSVSMLKDRFYFKFPDALTFNYLMTMALDFYKHKYMFFPLTWKEEGQISSVNAAKQGFDLLFKFFKYLMNKEKFIKSEIRAEIIDSYKSNCIYENALH